MNSLTSPPVSLVTGANRGIGRVVAEQLAQLGYATLLGCRDPGAGQEVAEREKTRTVLFLCAAQKTVCPLIQSFR